MKNVDWKLWDNITFKTHGYRKNFDLVENNESFITEYDGEISEIRIKKRKPPIMIGEYGISVWNIELGNKFGTDFYELLKKYMLEDTYEELLNLVEKNEFNLNKYKKIVLVHTIILRKEYRKRGITEELTEMLYRDFYSDDVVVLMLVKPFQDNTIDADYYLNRKEVLVRESIKPSIQTKVSGAEYYSLGEFIEKDDAEMNEYKLFAVANRCGFQRINESFLFIFTPEKIIKRMLMKQKYSKIKL